MKNAQHVDVAAWLHEVRDSIVAEPEDADMAIAVAAVLLPQLREMSEQLRLSQDASDGAHRGVGVIAGDVLVDSAKPAARLVRPVYFSHEEICASISWWETVRPASESARPRSII